MDNKINQQLLFLCLLILATVFVTYSNSFKDDIPDCDGYVVNVYLYLLLGLLITAFTVLFIAKRRYAITTTISLVAFLVAIAALFGLYAVDPRSTLLNHVIWLLFIIAIAVPVYSVWRYSEYTETLNSTLLITAILVAGLTAVAYFRPDWVNLNWGWGLSLVLLAGILAWIIPGFFAEPDQMTPYYKGLSAVFVVVFMLLILYDTKMLRVRAANCVVPDYPQASIGLFLDVINLFQNISLARS
jgi:FtsH-binding integral membrane protein